MAEVKMVEGAEEVSGVTAGELDVATWDEGALARRGNPGAVGRAARTCAELPAGGAVAEAVP